MIDENGWKKAVLQANEMAAACWGVEPPDRAVVVSTVTLASVSSHYAFVVNTKAAHAGFVQTMQHGVLGGHMLLDDILNELEDGLFVFLDRLRAADNDTLRECALVDPSTLRDRTIMGRSVIVPYEMP